MRKIRTMIWATIFFLAFSTGVAKGQSEPERASSPNDTTVHDTKNASPNSITKKERAKIFVRGAFGPSAIAGAAVTGGLNQERDKPATWPQGAGGFARRFGSAFGQHVVKESIMAGVGAAHHEDPRHYRSHESGFWTRTKYAVKSTFVVPRTDREGKTVSLGRLSGDFGSGMVSRAWWPTTGSVVATGLESGGISLGVDVGANVFREFWPDIHRKFRRHAD
ncbi:MAG: hypothetical protein PHX83_13095 [Acidobacteriia bacterium]|nr:hypothetical protein [Terriglobia bacterium]